RADGEELRRRGALAPRPGEDERHGDASGLWFLEVEAVLRVLDLEQLAERPGGLRGAKPEEAARFERVVENRHEVLLQQRLEVDQQVATADEIHPRKRWIGGDVVFGEDAHVADGLGHAILA